MKVERLKRPYIPDDEEVYILEEFGPEDAPLCVEMINFFREHNGKGFSYNSMQSWPDVFKLGISPETIAEATGIDPKIVEESLRAGKRPYGADGVTEAQSDRLAFIVNLLTVDITAIHSHGLDMMAKSNLSDLLERNKLPLATVALYADWETSELEAFYRGAANAQPVSDKKLLALCSTVMLLNTALNYLPRT